MNQGRRFVGILTTKSFLLFGLVLTALNAVGQYAWWSFYNPVEPFSSLAPRMFSLFIVCILVGIILGMRQSQTDSRR